MTARATSAVPVQPTADADGATTRSVQSRAVDEAHSAARAAGSPPRRERLTGAGRLLPRERIEALVDQGSFREMDGVLGLRLGSSVPTAAEFTEGVVAGVAAIDDRPVAIYMQDPTIRGGTVGAVGGRKISELTDLGARCGMPVVGLIDGGGARIQEGVDAQTAYGWIFRSQVAASGVVPQLSVVLGGAVGGAVYSPALTDLIFMIEGVSQMAIAGPDVIAKVTGERVTLEELGGAGVHSGRTGIAAFVAPDESALFRRVREVLSFLPSRRGEAPPARASADVLDRDCGFGRWAGPGQGPSAWEVATEIVDERELLPYCAAYGVGLGCGFGRLGGRATGVVTFAELAGLDAAVCEKGARFIRLCHSYSLPLLIVGGAGRFGRPGDGSGADLVRRAASLVFAVADAQVPKIGLLVGRASSFASGLLQSREIGIDWSFAWPGAVSTGDETGAGGATGADVGFAAWRAAVAGRVHEVIDPADSRRALGQALAILDRQRRAAAAPRKHENMPL